MQINKFSKSTEAICVASVPNCFGRGFIRRTHVGIITRPTQMTTKSIRRTDEFGIPGGYCLYHRTCEAKDDQMKAITYCWYTSPLVCGDLPPLVIGIPLQRKPVGIDSTLLLRAKCHLACPCNQLMKRSAFAHKQQSKTEEQYQQYRKDMAEKSSKNAELCAIHIWIITIYD